MVDFNEDTLENYIKYTYEKDDLFFGLNANIYQTLKETTDEKYEYILPEITLDKNLYSDEDLGIVGLQSNLKIHNFQTNKLLNSFVNDFDWSSKNFFTSKKKTKLLGNIKNINYEAKNIDKYKDSPTSELYVH